MRCIYCLVKEADYVVIGNSICKDCLIDIDKNKKIVNPQDAKGD